jgi:hypothetical protein
MQEAGEPLKPKYSKAPYGPYAENLRHVLTAMEGHYLEDYSDGGDQTDKEITLLAGSHEEASSLLSRAAQR